MSIDSSEAPKHSTVLDPAAQQLGRIYAQSLLAAAKNAGAGDEVVDQLQALEIAVREHSVLREVFSSPRVSHQEKVRVLDRLVGQQIHPVLMRFLKVAAQRGRLGFLGEMSLAANAIRDEALGRVVAFVRTATPLTDTLRSEVKREIGRMVAREVVLRETVDPAVIGGIVVRVGDTVYDSSIAGRLQRMNQGLKASFTSRLMQRADQYFGGEVAG